MGFEKLEILREKLKQEEETGQYSDQTGNTYQTGQYTDYTSNTYQIVSKVAYLSGVAKHIFENEHEPPKIEFYEKLNQDKNARIIRNLCRVRTALEQHYSKIIKIFQYEMKSINTIPEYVPADALNELTKDGISLYRNRPEIDQYIIMINKELANRIGNCRGLFPEWINWNYIKALFIMPNGMKVDGVRAAGREYIAHIQRYPYQVYLNWVGGDEGNILYSDLKFVQLLYEQNEDYFEDKSLVSGSGSIANNNIYEFIEKSRRLTIVVDCENSDPVKLAAFLSSIPPVHQNKISKVMLFDSDYTTSGWGILSSIPGIPYEHIVVKRLIETKSQVDMTLAAHTCKEVYRNGVDSVILVSSDSDYWALIQTLSDVDFMVMIEKEKCSYTMKNALEEQNIYYCFLDDFCTGASYKIKTGALIKEINTFLKRRVNFNVNEMMDEALHESWIQMTESERQNFYDRYIKRMRLVIDPLGNVSVELDNA